MLSSIIPSQAMDSENEERIKQLMYEKYHLKTKLVSFHSNPSSCTIKVQFCNSVWTLGRISVRKMIAMS